MIRGPKWAICLIGSVIGLTSIGCTYYDKLVSRWTVENGPTAEQVEQFIAQHPTLSASEASDLRLCQLRPGSSRGVVEFLGGKKLTKLAEHLWLLRDQFPPAAPARGPVVFDAREVFLYFSPDGNNTSLAAIIVRGHSLYVYPL